MGVCAINALQTLGKGQRIAIMAGSGVGKSVLMGMISRNTAADVIVIALIGETWQGGERIHRKESW